MRKHPIFNLIHRFDFLDQPVITPEELEDPFGVNTSREIQITMSEAYALRKLTDALKLDVGGLRLVAEELAEDTRRWSSIWRDGGFRMKRIGRQLLRLCDVLDIRIRHEKREDENGPSN